MTDDGSATRRLLRSWKEIGAHLDVTARTAQNWEKERGLPVRRQGDGARPRVVGYTDELDAWLAAQVEIDDSPRPAWRRRSIAAAIALATIAVFAAGFALDRVADVPACSPETVIGDPDSGIVRAYSLDGALCFERDLGPTVDWSDPVRIRGGRTLVRDLDGDGTNEVLIIERAPNNNSTSILHCLDSGGDDRWRFTYDRVLRDPDTGDVFHMNYQAFLLGIVEVDGVPQVVTHATQRRYPAYVAVLDGPTGRLAGWYVHPGHVHRALLHDLDGDGRPELIISGVNNPGLSGIGRPYLAVLDLPLPPPDDAHPNIFGILDSAPERDYLLFPGLDEIPGTLDVHEIEILEEGLLDVTVIRDPDRVYHYLVTPAFELAQYSITDRARQLYHETTGRPIDELTINSGGYPIRVPAAPNGNDPALRDLPRCAAERWHTNFRVVDVSELGTCPKSGFEGQLGRSVPDR